jgi:hypothetical protein
MVQIGTRCGEDKVDNAFVMSDALTRVLDLPKMRMNVHSQIFKRKVHAAADLVRAGAVRI